MILGTAAYMAPEQASGKPVDKRADIFAFGVVLWEMLTGRQMFQGETVSHLLAAVLTQAPDLAAAPPQVRHLLARCLEKDPKKRLRDIGDAMSLVEVARLTDVAPPLRPAARLASVGGWLTAAVVAAIALVAWARPAPPLAVDPPVVRLSIARALDLYAQTASAFALSPDGLRLAYFDHVDDGRYALLVCTLATGEVRELTAALLTFGPRPDSLAWSPDGRRLVRGMQTAAVVVDVTTGASRPLCECRMAGSAGTPTT